MLVRLERSGFIRRVPGKARAIEVLVPAAIAVKLMNRRAQSK